MFEELWKIRFSECDRHGMLSYKGVVNYFQDSSNSQSEKSDMGLAFLQSRNRAWILDFWQIVIERRPGTFEQVKVATWPNGFKGLFGTRNFLMRSVQDEVLAYANSCWVYLDTATGRPTKITDEEIAMFELEEPYPMETVERKMKVPDELEYVESVKVKEHHLDVYNHVNNASYIEMACDYINEGQEIYQISCQYRRQARLDDEIRVYRNVSQQAITIVLKDTEDSIYTILKLDIK